MPFFQVTPIFLLAYAPRTPPPSPPAVQSAFINNTSVERSPLLSPLIFPSCAGGNLHSTLALIYLNAFPRKNNHLNNKQIEQQCCQLTTATDRPSSGYLSVRLRALFVYACVSRMYINSHRIHKVNPKVSSVIVVYV